MVPNPKVNRIFEYHYRTFLVDNIANFSMDELTSLKKKSEVEQSKKLLEDAEKLLDKMEAELKTIAPTPEAKPEDQPEITTEPEGQPEEEIATVNAPQYGSPQPEEPEEKAPGPTIEVPAVVPEPGLTRKPSDPDSAAKLPNNVVELPGSSAPPKEEIELIAQQNLLKGKLESPQAAPAVPATPAKPQEPILKAAPKPILKAKATPKPKKPKQEQEEQKPPQGPLDDIGTE